MILVFWIGLFHGMSFVSVQGHLADEEAIEDWPTFLETVRENGLKHSKAWPDFVCTQVIKRYYDPKGAGEWLESDILEAELSFYGDKEHYRSVRVNGQPSGEDYEKVVGALSMGEFGTILRNLLMPESEASFWKKGEEVLDSLPTVVIGFSVPQATSGWTLSYGRSHALRLSYRGQIWVDPKTRRVLKINQQPDELPATFPISHAEMTTEYRYLAIKGIEGQFLLPVRAELILRESKDASGYRNVSEFRGYQKFMADVRFVP